MSHVEIGTVVTDKHSSYFMGWGEARGYGGIGEEPSPLEDYDCNVLDGMLVDILDKIRYVTTNTHREIHITNIPLTSLVVVEVGIDVRILEMCKRCGVDPTTLEC